MEPGDPTSEPLTSLSRRLAKRLLITGGNRVELLLVEVQEERERLLHTFFLALAVAVLGLLAGLALSVAIVIWWWPSSPVVVLLALTGTFGIAAAALAWRLRIWTRDWQTLAATLDQLRKDRDCLDELLA